MTMKKNSKIYKTLIYGDEVSLAVLDTTALVNELINRHSLSPLAAAALGRTVTVSAYLCSWLKGEDDGLSVTIDGDGAGGKICVSGNSQFHMRGFIEHPDVTLPPRADGKLDVGGCVGKNGTLTVIREDGDSVPFVGTSELVSGEIAEDFSAYFYTSEQRPTAIALGVKIGTDGKCIGAGGVIMQPLPFASEESLEQIERTILQFSSVSTMIKEIGAEGILREKFSAREWVDCDVHFQCHCSREKIEGILHSMGKEEALSIVKEEGKISVYCHYCNTDYTFDGKDVEKIFQGDKTE
ncbi:MAG: Hsp33 family molecular chaperone HslO [Clostridia bacterium]|nr:Hsp33 family molecular chaperone HslO [Clostridia bacterium]